jgi:hypothetical protein
VTQEEAEALGVRLAACPHFRPLRGIRDLQGRTWDEALLWRWNATIDRPDVRDAATRGVLLELVREAYSEPTMHVRWNAGLGRWDVVARYSFPACASSEEEALAAALENAP